ncbi:phosphatase PAP2 family protein [Streptomyces cacaoi]|uniref:phosphatase PAP2 family protein n=1 Tax=Streptomyces cacaoi TaxID=1898 RepID=UPI0033279B96
MTGELPVVRSASAAPSAGPAARTDRAAPPCAGLLVSLMAACLVAFAALSYYVLAHGAGAVDNPVLHEAVRQRGDLLDAFMARVSQLSELPLSVLCALAAAGLARQRRSWRPLVLVVAAGVLAVLVASAAKDLTDRSRPPSALWGVPEDGYCYPSRHVVVGTAVLLMLAFVWTEGVASRRARTTVWAGTAAVCGLVGYSRIHLAVHWPTDIAAGLFLGASLMLLVLLAATLLAAAAGPPVTAATPAARHRDVDPGLPPPGG